MIYYDAPWGAFPVSRSRYLEKLRLTKPGSTLTQVMSDIRLAQAHHPAGGIQGHDWGNGEPNGKEPRSETETGFMYGVDRDRIASFTVEGSLYNCCIGCLKLTST